MRTKMISKIIANSGGNADHPSSPLRFDITLSPPIVLPPDTYMSVDKIKINLDDLEGEITPPIAIGMENYFIGVEGLGGAFCGIRLVAPPSSDPTLGSSAFNLKHGGIIYMDDNASSYTYPNMPENGGIFSLNNNKEVVVSQLTFQLYGHNGRPLIIQDFTNFTQFNQTKIQLSFFKHEDMSEDIRDLIATLKSNNQLAIDNNNTDPENIDNINSN
jgi:hypothetical protein